jgi:hypothetical protein
MSRFLVKYGYEYNFKVKLEVPIDKFQQRIEGEIENGWINIFSTIYPNSNDENCDYFGFAEKGKLKFKKKNKFWDQNLELITARFEEEEGATIIRVKISGIHGILKLFLLVIVFMLLVFVLTFFGELFKNKGDHLWLLFSAVILFLKLWFVLGYFKWGMPARKAELLRLFEKIESQ